MKNLFFLLFIFVSALTTVGCGKDDGDPLICTLYNERVPGALLALSNAVDDYNSNPNTENCRVYRFAAEDYLETLRLYETCSFLVDDADYQERINRAEQNLNDIEC